MKNLKIRMYKVNSRIRHKPLVYWFKDEFKIKGENYINHYINFFGYICMVISRRLKNENTN